MINTFLIPVYLNRTFLCRKVNQLSLNLFCLGFLIPNRFQTEWDWCPAVLLLQTAPNRTYSSGLQHNKDRLWLEVKKARTSELMSCGKLRELQYPVLSAKWGKDTWQQTGCVAISMFASYTFSTEFSWPLGWSSQLVSRWIDDKQTWDTCGPVLVSRISKANSVLIPCSGLTPSAPSSP